MYDREKASAIMQKIADARSRGKRPKLSHAEALIIEKYLDEKHWCLNHGGVKRVEPNR
jgi:hypothetical protein